MDHKFFEIESYEFLPQPGEAEDLVNEGMFGAGVSEFLQTELTKLGYGACYFNEDWGWCITAEKDDADMLIGIYCLSEESDVPMRYSATVFTQKTKRMIWRKLKSVSIVPQLKRLQKDLEAILQSAPKTKIKRITSDFPD